jgi:hypothetical protein
MPRELLDDVVGEPRRPDALPVAPRSQVHETYPVTVARTEGVALGTQPLHERSEVRGEGASAPQVDEVIPLWHDDAASDRTNRSLVQRRARGADSAVRRRVRDP